MSKIVELVEMVANTLVAYGAVKDLMPISKSEDIQDTMVSVIGGPETWVKQSRGATYLVSYDVIVFVQGRVEDDDIEDFLTLSENIKSTVKTLGASEILQPTPYDQERLYTESIFTTQITIRFKGFK